ncbi:hypothetical protein ACFFHH_20375 [Cytobacillus solani]|uniref:Uncharacterized protein n=1 Tax=Cytobacillus solani TaxID=1637975 RepID=A0A0Q3QS60_9BACI|nr:hypothetical protein [Cytobacillus solani]KOP84113.1 hypothetical protein AMS60_00245 [Bacillus sp. FJAT-21945]KQL20993.1 hypothetical protein AN957_22035 [Cytobacillus solani]
MPSLEDNKMSIQSSDGGKNYAQMYDLADGTYLEVGLTKETLQWVSIGGVGVLAAVLAAIPIVGPYASAIVGTIMGFAVGKIERGRSFVFKRVGATGSKMQFVDSYPWAI